MNEIEKKFLCDRVKFYNFLETSVPKEDVSSEIISQKYYINNSKFEFRVRTSYDLKRENKFKTYFTIKSKNILIRKEYEFSVSLFLVWLFFVNYNSIKNNIIKSRINFTYNTIKYSVDDFIVPSHLLLCEVELATETQSIPNLPFFIKDVTSDLNYYNSNIVKSINIS